MASTTGFKVRLKDLRIAPRKVRLVANLIKGMQVNEALAQLTVVTSRPADPIIKLLRSAIANAKSAGASIDNLVVKEVLVDQGTLLKRYLPRAQGRATPIHKRFSHVTLVVAESASSKAVRFDLAKAEKKPRKEAKPQKAKAKTSETKAQAKAKGGTERPGFFKKVFRRKAI